MEKSSQGALLVTGLWMAGAFVVPFQHLPIYGALPLLLILGALGVLWTLLQIQRLGRSLRRRKSLL
jgi:hypothetical protein